MTGRSRRAVEIVLGGAICAWVVFFRGLRAASANHGDARVPSGLIVVGFPFGTCDKLSDPTIKWPDPASSEFAALLLSESLATV